MKFAVALACAVLLAGVLHASTYLGSNRILFLRDGVVTSTATLPNVVSPGWVIRGTFNDGRFGSSPGILWQNTQTGLVVLWKLYPVICGDGFGGNCTMSYGAYETLTTLDPSEDVVAIKDLDGDGKDDLVIRQVR